MRKFLATLAVAILALGTFAPERADAQTYASSPTYTTNSYTFTPREEFEFAISCAFPDAVFTYDWTDEEFESLTWAEALSTVYTWSSDGYYYPMTYPNPTTYRGPYTPESAFIWSD